MDGIEHPLVVCVTDGKTEKNYEKITINLPAVDLGKIDYLVNQGFYNTRTEFIRTAIKHEVEKNAFTFDSIIREKASETRPFYGLGVFEITRSALEKHLNQGTKMKIFVIGMCVFDKDIDVDLVKETVESFRVFGIKKAAPGVIDFLESLKYIP
jgi:hypothetical protein